VEWTDIHSSLAVRIHPSVQISRLLFSVTTLPWSGYWSICQRTCSKSGLLNVQLGLHRWMQQ